MIATLTKQPTNSFSLSARRYTDPWGVTRVGASTGKPDQRYCANLGHRQDDESGLTYMRARYYEPTTGRFVSEDPAMDGGNWYAFAKNQPTVLADPSGRSAWWVHATLFSGYILGCLAYWQLSKCQGTYIGEVTTAHHLSRAVALTTMAVGSFTIASIGLTADRLMDPASLTMLGGVLAMAQGTIQLMTASAAVGSKTLAAVGLAAAFLYGLAHLAEYLATELAFQGFY